MKKPRHKQKKPAKPKAAPTILNRTQERTYDLRRTDALEIQYGDRGHATDSDAWKKHQHTCRD